MNHLGNSVQHVAEIFRDDVAPVIASSVIEATSKVAMSTKESIQKGAEFLSKEVAPVIEDTVVEMSNAALPVVNKGIDVVGAGLNVGVNVVSKTTSSGLEHFGAKVLGEQRKKRIQKIANNLSVNFNNSINSLAGAIKKVTTSSNNDESEKSETIKQPNIYYYPTTYGHLYSYLYPYYFQQYPPESFKPGNTREEETLLRSAKNMSLSEAFGKIMSNKAYSLSQQYLGPNFTEAVAPIARSVSNVIGQNLPSVTIGATTSAADKMRTCTTPDKRRGFCQDLSDCPDLVLKLSVLRRSVCFKSLFSPGVCCPDVGQL